MLDLLLAGHAVTFAPQPDIYLEVIGEASNTKPWAFYAPHENEHVANQYVAKQIREKGGVFVILRQNGEREITLKFDGQSIKVDPNRIFTKPGIRSSIKKMNLDRPLSEDILDSATQRAFKLGQFVIQQMGGENNSVTWVATHNNTQGYTGDANNGVGTVSIKRYQNKLAAGAGYLIDVHDAGNDEDDLFFITEKTHFEAMKSAGYNVVLQHPQVAWLENQDDGSMSVYAEMKGIGYINVEAERYEPFLKIGKDHLQQQQQMVDFTFEMLSKERKNN